MSKYDTIKEVPVEKFNPFHDAQGKFSSSNGFKSYSANPNTKAGAMAIARSAAAGHGNTVNVHRQSYGENIRQNANWMAQGNSGTMYHGRQSTGNATLTRRVEPLTGLAGASRRGATWQAQNQQQGRTTKPGKQQAAGATTTAQTQQTPKPKPNTQQAAQKPAQQAQQAQKPASDRKPVDGKDISSSFQYSNRSKGNALDQVADQQGYKGKPQVVKDSGEFSTAVKASGIMAYRTIKSGNDAVTGKYKTGSQFADDLKNSDTFAHNGNGMRAYGGGLYIAATQNSVKGQAPSRSSTNAAKSDSRMYGGGLQSSKQVGMTLDPSAKIGDYSKVRSEFNRLPASKRQNFGNDVGAYAASKGYDGLRAVDAGWGCDYITVYNRTKLVIYDG